MSKDIRISTFRVAFVENNSIKIKGKYYELIFTTIFLQTEKDSYVEVFHKKHGFETIATGDIYVEKSNFQLAGSQELNMKLINHH